MLGGKPVTDAYIETYVFIHHRKWKGARKMEPFSRAILPSKQ